ncbi:type II secretion system protein [Granulicella sp. dw_53]|uniref:type II secretion system protein n=1 Tax=Granulicella sp. dw_53 TaxID=2719792 RepID=UPI001BD2C398|nr:type II secretion system protein [Granulicella sp. dw_53]
MRRDGNEDGFALIALVVAIFLVLLALGVAAPRVAQQLRREREVEAVHRGNQYVRAVQLYYKKFGNYPGSIDQLEKSNNIRFLRQKYLDPMTGKSDWRLIHVGEAKTTVKGFFGQPLSGLASGLGSAAGLASGGSIGAGATGSTSGGSSSYPTGGLGGSSSSSSSGSGSSAFGSGSAGSSSFGSNPGSSPSAFGNSGLGSSNPGSSQPGSSSSTGGSGISSQSATDFKGSGAPFVGIGSAAPGNSILVLNEQTTYGTWEFIYDPRIEQLKAKSSLFGGGPASTSAGSLGSAQSNVSPGLGGATTPTSGTSPTTSPSTPSSPPSTSP